MDLNQNLIFKNIVTVHEIFYFFIEKFKRE
jgi:hypothetical protein